MDDGGAGPAWCPEEWYTRQAMALEHRGTLRPRSCLRRDPAKLGGLSEFRILQDSPPGPSELPDGRKGRPAITSPREQPLCEFVEHSAKNSPAACCSRAVRRMNQVKKGDAGYPALRIGRMTGAFCVTIACRSCSKTCMSSALAVSLSGCHCTPRQNQFGSSASNASITPSGAVAET